MRTACPSCTPAGMRTVTTRLRNCRPVPPQLKQCSLTTLPRPRQFGQVVTMRNIPPKPCCATRPCPPHCTQTIGDDPALAPVPLQTSQLSCFSNSIVFSVPLATSASDSSTCVSRSNPRCGRPARPPPPAPPAPPPARPNPPPSPPKISSNIE